MSIILPVRNEKQSIVECLSAVLNQDYPPDHTEVLVADGMSDDGTRAILAELAAGTRRVKVLDNLRRIAPAGLNLCIGAATGDIIIRVDGHAVLPPNYVRECVRWQTQESVDCVGGAMESVGRGHVGEAIALVMGSRFGVGNAGFRTTRARDGAVPTDTVPFGAFRREVFERVGLFREDMLCHEDYEFNHRLRMSGGQILLVPALRAKYYVRSTLKGACSQYWRYGVWKGRFLRSHPKSLRLRHLIPPLFVFTLALSTLFSVLLRSPLWICLSVVPYLCFLLIAAASLASGGHRRSAPMLPVILTFLHLCWGAGVWAGLVRGPVKGLPPTLVP